MRGRATLAAGGPWMCLGGWYHGGARRIRAANIAIVKVTGDEAACDIGELWLLLRAARHRVGTARVKAAAGGRPQRARHLAGEDDLVAPLVGMGWERRREQRLGVGMLRRAGEGASVALLDDLAQIHDRDRVAYMGDCGEIMGNEEVGQPEFRLQISQQVEDLGPNRDVEGGDRLVPHTAPGG